MAWGPAGVGSDLEIGGRNLWDNLRVPFVSCLADNPFAFPIRHRPESQFIALGYFIEDWLDIQRRFMRSPRVSGLLPIFVPPNPHCDEIAWARRSNRMIFVKTGESPELRRSTWAPLPPRVRKVLEESANEACRHGVMGLTDLLLTSAQNHGLSFEDRPANLFFMMRELDWYVRAVRSTRMVEALAQVPAIIIGRGWEHVAKENARARFYPAIDATELPKLFGDSQFVVNTSPNFGLAPHERILYGFAARACVVSDQNTHTRTHFAELPSFFGVDIASGNLAEQIAAIWADPDDCGNVTDSALTFVETNHSAEKFIESSFALAMSAINTVRALA
jgi:hypothetical protein